MFFLLIIGVKLPCVSVTMLYSVLYYLCTSMHVNYVKLCKLCFVEYMCVHMNKFDRHIMIVLNTCKYCSQYFYLCSFGGMRILFGF